MIFKRACILAVIIFIGYVGLSTYTITSQNIHNLLVCSRHGNLNIPYAKRICHFYLFQFRGGPKDIANLQKHGGASFVIDQGPISADMQKTLTFLVSNGLDINEPSEAGYTPLQGAVLLNSFPKVQMLLEMGGNPQITGSATSLTPLQMAIRLNQSGKLLQSNQAIIALLRQASHTKE